MKNYFEPNATYIINPEMRDEFISSNPDNERLMPYLEEFTVLEYEPDEDHEEINPENSSVVVIESEGRRMRRSDIFEDDASHYNWLTPSEAKYFILGETVERYDVMVSQQDGKGYYIRALDKTEEECEAWALDWLESYPNSDVVMIKRFKKLSLKVTKEVISVPFD